MKVWVRPLNQETLAAFLAWCLPVKPSMFDKSFVSKTTPRTTKSKSTFTYYLCLPSRLPLNNKCHFKVSLKLFINDSLINPNIHSYASPSFCQIRWHPSSLFACCKVAPFRRRYRQRFAKYLFILLQPFPRLECSSFQVLLMSFP